jgi:hypothetical protein
MHGELPPLTGVAVKVTANYQNRLLLMAMYLPIPLALRKMTLAW